MYSLPPARSSPGSMHERGATTGAIVPQQYVTRRFSRADKVRRQQTRTETGPAESKSGGKRSAQRTVPGLPPGVFKTKGPNRAADFWSCHVKRLGLDPAATARKPLPDPPGRGGGRSRHRKGVAYKAGPSQRVTISWGATPQHPTAHPGPGRGPIPLAGLARAAPTYRPTGDRITRTTSTSGPLSQLCGNPPPPSPAEVGSFKTDSGGQAPPSLWAPGWAGRLRYKRNHPREGGRGQPEHREALYPPLPGAEHRGGRDQSRRALIPGP